MSETLTIQRPVNLFDISGFTLTDVGLSVTNPGVSFDDAAKAWGEIRSTAGQVVGAHRCMQFAVGDFMVWAEERFGEHAFQLFDKSDWESSRNWRWVCRAIPIEDRRPELHVSYGHYRAVAALGRDDRRRYLCTAAEQGLSVRAMAAKIEGDKIDSLLAGLSEEDRQAWVELVNELHPTAAELQEAMTLGDIDAARNALSKSRQLSFDEWLSDYMPDADDAMRAHLLAAWEAGRKGQQ